MTFWKLENRFPRKAGKLESEKAWFLRYRGPGEKPVSGKVGNNPYRNIRLFCFIEKLGIAFYVIPGVYKINVLVVDPYFWEALVRVFPNTLQF